MLTISLKPKEHEIEQEFSSFDCILTKVNTPPMPLSDAHLGGLFFYYPPPKKSKMEDWKKIKENWEKIKVDPKIKPTNIKNRKPVELVVGKEYYVCFGKNEVSRCQLSEIDPEKNTITIEIPPKSISKNSYIDDEGNFFHPTVYFHTLFPDEIGQTPEEAVMNTVTS